MRGRRPHLALTLLAAVLLAGCSKRPAGQPRSTPAFDQRWAAVTAQGAQPFYVEDDRGAAMRGSVLGAQVGALDMSALLQQSYKGGAPLPDQPDREQVQRLMRQYLPGVKSCYQRLSQDGVARSGKALVSFQIAGNGRVQALNVEAPAFDGTALPSCITGQVSRWAFPPSRRGLGALSYPFVFVAE